MLLPVLVLDSCLNIDWNLPIASYEIRKVPNHDYHQFQSIRSTRMESIDSNAMS